MANEYTVNAADLTAVADAIRTKGGTSAELSFPTGFASAIAAISSGAQVASGTVTVSRATTAKIAPGFTASRVCIAGNANSLPGFGYYNAGTVGGKISAYAPATGKITFASAVDGTLFWIAAE